MIIDNKKNIAVQLGAEGHLIGDVTDVAPKQLPYNIKHVTN